MSAEDEQSKMKKVEEYLTMALRGPTAADREVMMLVDDFIRFLTLQMFRQMISVIPKVPRDAMCKEIIDNWCRRARRHTNDVVKQHEQTLQVAGAELLINSLGDGENLRVHNNKQINRAADIVRRWFEGVVDGLPND
jgi:hypothetical protein